MGVEIAFSKGIMTAILKGDIDHHTAREMREAIDNYVSEEGPRLLNMDFSGIQFMDSSGIGLIMGRYKLMKSIGGNLFVINIPKRIERMVKLSGLMNLGIFKE